MKPLLVLTQCPNRSVAESLAAMLVAERLAACVSILPATHSVYRWQGHIEHAEETPLLIKTTEDCYARLEAAILAAHPYDVPEIIALPISHGLPAYLNWIAAETEEAP